MERIESEDDGRDDGRSGENAGGELEMESVLECIQPVVSDGEDESQVRQSRHGHQSLLVTQVLASTATSTSQLIPLLHLLQ